MAFRKSRAVECVVLDDLQYLAVGALGHGTGGRAAGHRARVGDRQHLGGVRRALRLRLRQLLPQALPVDDGAGGGVGDGEVEGGGHEEQHDDDAEDDAAVHRQLGRLAAHDPEDDAADGDGQHRAAVDDQQEAFAMRRAAVADRGERHHEHREDGHLAAWGEDAETSETR